MAVNYSANQFEGAFRPRALCNWEVPRRPAAGGACLSCGAQLAQGGATAGGRLGGGGRARRCARCGPCPAPCPPCFHRQQHCPWGDFRGTWALPRRITRACADHINGSEKCPCCCPCGKPLPILCYPKKRKGR